MTLSDGARHENARSGFPNVGVGVCHRDDHGDGDRVRVVGRYGQLRVVPSLCRGGSRTGDGAPIRSRSPKPRLDPHPSRHLCLLDRERVQRRCRPRKLERSPVGEPMQTRPLPEIPDARSPAGAEIRYLIDGATGNMFHSTVPPGQVNRAGAGAFNLMPCMRPVVRSGPAQDMLTSDSNSSSRACSQTAPRDSRAGRIALSFVLASSNLSAVSSASTRSSAARI